MNLTQMKNTVLAVLAAAGSAVAQALGGWDVALKVLICFMALDYVTGWLVAAVWHKSAKSKTGALDSKASKNLLEIMTRMNRDMGATILMVTHDAYSASYAARVLFLKDGRLFHELLRGERGRPVFYHEVLDVLALLGGDVSDVI